MANAIYDPRIEPHHKVVVVDEETGRFLGWMEAVCNMTTTAGNSVESICVDGIKICDGQTGDEHMVKEAEIPLGVARQFGFERTPVEISDQLIAGINECRHLNGLWSFERRWRDLWRRLNQYPCEVQPPGHSNNSFTEYFRVMKAFAEHKRNLETGRTSNQ